MNLKLIVGAKALNTAVVGCIKSASGAQEKIHLVATSCLAHAAEHGDTTLLARLVYGLPKGVRVSALKDWAREFSPVEFFDKEMKCKLTKGDDAKPFDIEGASTLPFFEMKKGPAKVELTLDAIVEYLARKAKPTDKDTEKVKAVRAQIAKIATYARVVASPVSDDMASAGFSPAPEQLKAA